MMKLKTCPFCGQEAAISYYSDNINIKIYCPNKDCFLWHDRNYHREGKETTVNRWNTRAAEPSTTAPDNVNHPSHYETNGIECIDAMKAVQGVSAVQDFCICNAFKYIWRHKHKNGAEDIKKAVWYLNKWLELERRYKTGNERF